MKPMRSELPAESRICAHEARSITEASGWIAQQTELTSTRCPMGQPPAEAVSATRARRIPRSERVRDWL